jgi:hypothetical protein
MSRKNKTRTIIFNKLQPSILNDSHTTFDQVTDVLCYTKPGDNPTNWKIALPKKLIKSTLKWYHQVTGHPGSKRLYEQIRQRYHNRDLRRYIENFNCDYCQRNKLDGKGYGLLPDCEVQSIPFKECAVDLVGPWVVQVHGNPYKFEALTVIDTVTNLVQLIKVDKKPQTLSQESMHNVGYQVTRGHKDVYMI